MARFSKVRYRNRSILLPGQNEIKGTIYNIKSQRAQVVNDPEVSQFEHKISYYKNEFSKA